MVTFVVRVVILVIVVVGAPVLSIRWMKVEFMTILLVHWVILVVRRGAEILRLIYIGRWAILWIWEIRLVVLVLISVWALAIFTAEVVQINLASTLVICLTCVSGDDGVIRNIWLTTVLLAVWT